MLGPHMTHTHVGRYVQQGDFFFFEMVQHAGFIAEPPKNARNVSLRGILTLLFLVGGFILAARI